MDFIKLMILWGGADPQNGKDRFALILSIGVSPFSINGDTPIDKIHFGRS